MTYFTETEARNAARQGMIKKAVRKSHDKVLEEAAARSSDHDEYDVFLSHSIRDAELVDGIKNILEQQGFSVYVDWKSDPHLDRDAVSKETAELLRKRMRQSKSLIYVATPNASSSKWMPWELGYFDGFNPGQVAVLPLMGAETDTFAKQEYLALYPEVTKSKYTDGRSDYFVEDRGIRWQTLSKFGQGIGPWKKYG